jgi:hypothetical protein
MIEGANRSEYRVSTILPAKPELRHRGKHVQGRESWWRYHSF